MDNHNGCIINTTSTSEAPSIKATVKRRISSKAGEYLGEVGGEVGGGEGLGGGWGRRGVGRWMGRGWGGEGWGGERGGGWGRREGRWVGEEEEREEGSHLHRGPLQADLITGLWCSPLPLKWPIMC